MELIKIIKEDNLGLEKTETLERFRDEKDEEDEIKDGEIMRLSNVYIYTRSGHKIYMYFHTSYVHTCVVCTYVVVRHIG